jgi:DNA polymerase-3 subunit epsilon
VDASNRQLHGALLDARLLAEVYLELRGGRQPDLAISATVVATTEIEITETRAREFLAPRPHEPSEEELAAHEAFLAQITDPLWRRSA